MSELKNAKAGEKATLTRVLTSKFGSTGVMDGGVLEEQRVNLSPEGVQARCSVLE